MNRALEQEHMNFCLERLYGHRRPNVASDPFGFATQGGNQNESETAPPALTAQSSADGHQGIIQSKMTFIEKVLKILDDAPVRGFEQIICWEPNGLSFKVHNIKAFEVKILPEYLQQTKLRSFQRQ